MPTSLERAKAGVNLNIVTYTALLDGLCEDGRMREAEELFGALLKAEWTLNQQIYTSLFHGYIKAKMMEKAMDIL